MELSVKSQRKRQVIDLTGQVGELLPSGFTGIALTTVLHSGCAVTAANLDPGTDLDLLDALDLLIPDRPWRHPHNPSHAPDHLLASIVGPSVALPVENGQLVRGMWQFLVLIEFDGPRTRRINVTLAGSQSTTNPAA